MRVLFLCALLVLSVTVRSSAQCIECIVDGCQNTVSIPDDENSGTLCKSLNSAMQSSTQSLGSDCADKSMTFFCNALAAQAGYCDSTDFTPDYSNWESDCNAAISCLSSEVQSQAQDSGVCVPPNVDSSDYSSDYSSYVDSSATQTCKNCPIDACPDVSGMSITDWTIDSSAPTCDDLNSGMASYISSARNAQCEDTIKTFLCDFAQQSTDCNARITNLRSECVAAVDCMDANGAASALSVGLCDSFPVEDDTTPSSSVTSMISSSKPASSVVTPSRYYWYNIQQYPTTCLTDYDGAGWDANCVDVPEEWLSPSLNITCFHCGEEEMVSSSYCSSIYPNGYPSSSYSCNQTWPIIDITVVNKTSLLNEWHAQGFKAAYAVNGLEGAELTLWRGVTYQFNLNNVPSIHPFYFTNDSTGGQSAVNSYAFGKGRSGSTQLVWTVPMDAPDLLYYQCANHPKMGGKIHIVDNMEEYQRTINFCSGNAGGEGVTEEDTTPPSSSAASSVTSAPISSAPISPDFISPISLSADRSGDWWTIPLVTVTMGKWRCNPQTSSASSLPITSSRPVGSMVSSQSIDTTSIPASSPSSSSPSSPLASLSSLLSSAIKASSAPRGGTLSVKKQK